MVECTPIYDEREYVEFRVPWEVYVFHIDSRHGLMEIPIVLNDFPHYQPINMRHIMGALYAEN